MQRPLLMLLNVLITSPQPSAYRLGEKIKSLGFIPDLFPLIEFSPTQNQSLLKDKIHSLIHSDIIIFVSPRAAEYGMKAILNYGSSPPNVQYFCIGPGTQQVLKKYGIISEIPLCSPYESESLLAHPQLQLQQVNKKMITIFRGNGGRNLLYDTLIKRKAKVSVIECYERILPQADLNLKISQWTDTFPNMLVITSRESLTRFFTLLESELVSLKSLFLNIPTVVVGKRTANFATELGFKHCFISPEADDASLIATLTAILAENKKSLAEIKI